LTTPSAGSSPDRFARLLPPCSTQSFDTDSTLAIDRGIELTDSGESSKSASGPTIWPPPSAAIKATASEEVGSPCPNGVFTFREAARHLAEAYDRGPALLRPRPAGPADLARLQTSVAQAVDFVNVKLPQLLLRLEESKVSIQDLVASSGGGCSHFADGRGGAGIDTSSQETAQYRDLIEGMGLLQALLGDDMLRRDGLRSAVQPLEASAAFLQQVATIARLSGLAAWTVFEEVLQVRTYTTHLRAERRAASTAPNLVGRRSPTPAGHGIQSSGRADGH